MIVETPVKRLRILQPVEVDEANPDYIEAKQKQQQKFKSRLERIFDKYGSMHESMSDEIDFKTGKIVVDRGHTRRVQRQLTRKGPTLVDNFLGSALEENDASGDEEDRVVSEDELAPTQTRKRKRDSVEVAQSSAQQKATFVATPQYPSAELTQKNALQIPSTPNAAAHLLEGLQFPQTPLGQQAQAAFVANLNQTIVQAVQQVVAPLFSILQNTSNGQAARANLPVSSLQIPWADGVRPAADPKWYFPPISAVKNVPHIGIPRSSPPAVNEAPLATTDNSEISSPLTTRRRSPEVQIRMRSDLPKRKLSPQAQVTSVERPYSSHSSSVLPISASTCHDANPRVMNMPGCKPKRIRSVCKYQFTEDDDAYISERREIHNASFKDIKASKAKWSDWPLSAFYNRWQRRLKEKNKALQRTPKIRSTAQDCSPTPEGLDEHFFSSIEIPETSSAEHRLPTPSSLEQEDNSIPRVVVPSSSYFDDDELELLSLAGADTSDVLPTRTHDDDDDASPVPDEPLPSIEGAEFRNEDDLQLEMLKMEDSPTPEPTQPKTLPSTIPETQESAVIVPPPRQTKEKPMLNARTTYRASSNSSDDLDLIGVTDEPVTPHIRIKRESTTPQATRILCSSPALKTLRAVPQSSGMAKSTGKLSRRAFLNDVKKGWAKGHGRTSGLHKRRSFNMTPTIAKKTRAESHPGDSEDELAV
ncbi:hypothetical protein OPT61_g1495 [Boeremia exigua]|uniref:Uncharacterized protein n=1 Tax=Boeremia exigua TaxID=749465 RepID=A0ACC2IQB8_9PLEO|nr:hypothetical protein OPT61_g1495 [Boeremia exigua]